MHRRMNSSTQVSELCTIARLNDAQHVCMRWCSDWITCKPMYPRRSRMDKTIILQAFLVRKHAHWNRQNLFGKIVVVCQSWEHKFWACVWKQSDSGGWQRGTTFQIFPTDAVHFPLNLMTETMVQKGQPYALHELALAISQSSNMPGRIVQGLENYNELININQNISVTEITIQRVYACSELNSIGTMKNVLW